eukprot:328043_1
MGLIESCGSDCRRFGSYEDKRKDTKWKRKLMSELEKNESYRQDQIQTLQQEKQQLEHDLSHELEPQLRKIENKMLKIEYSEYKQDNSNKYGNNNNSDDKTNSFGFAIAKSIYHPISTKNVFNAKTQNDHVYDQYKFSHSPQPQQTYNLRPNETNNYPSNSAPSPNTNQIHETQQQFLPLPNRIHEGKLKKQESKAPKSIFDESSSDESDEEQQNNRTRLTVDITNAPNNAVSSYMGNLGKYK